MTEDEYEDKIEELKAMNADLTRALDKYEAQATYLRDVLLGLSGEIQWY